MDHLPLPGGAPAPKKGGVAPSTIPPSSAARRRAVRGGDTRGRRPTALYRRGLGQSVPTHVRCGFPGIASTTAARAAPSDSAVLWLSNACTTCVRHPTLVRWPPIRRHRRDPRRRKLSNHPAPPEAAVSSSAWSIFSTTAARPPWRSTVSQSASAMACRRTAASVLAAARSRVVQAWRTRWVRSRCCWFHFDDNPLDPFVHSNSGLQLTNRTV